MKNIYDEIYFFCKKCEQRDFWTDRETGWTHCNCSHGGHIYEHKKRCVRLHKHLVEVLGLKSEKEKRKMKEELKKREQQKDYNTPDYKSLYEQEKKLNEYIKVRFVKCNTCTDEKKEKCLMFHEDLCNGERCDELVDLDSLINKNILQKENEELKEQIEKMKCCGNCSEPCYNPPIIRKFECLNNNYSLWEMLK